MLESKRYNWALYLGIVLKTIPISLLIVFFIYNPEIANNYSEDYEDYYFGSRYSYAFSVFWAVVLAPIYEEVIFDGAFLKNKLLKIVSHVGLVFLTFSINTSLFSIAALLLFFLCSFLYHRSTTKKWRYQTFMIVSNSLLFSIIHINVNSLDITTPISLLSRFGGHLIALWLVLNYRLIYAILVHALWNGMLYLMSLLQSGQIDHDLKTVENEHVKIEYKIAENYKPYRINLSTQDSLKFETVQIEDLLFFTVENSDSVLSLYEKAPHRYDVIVIVKDTEIIGEKQIIGKELIKLLETDSLLVKK